MIATLFTSLALAALSPINSIRGDDPPMRVSQLSHRLVLKISMQQNVDSDSGGMIRYHRHD